MSDQRAPAAQVPGTGPKTSRVPCVGVIVTTPPVCRTPSRVVEKSARLRDKHHLPHKNFRILSEPVAPQGVYSSQGRGRFAVTSSLSRKGRVK